jgi:two-component system cell cycle response regulator
MKNKTHISALVAVNERENSWFLTGGFHESIDFHLLDVKALLVKPHDFQSTLYQKITEQAPDVLLLDSTLSPGFALRMAAYLRDKMPTLPIVLLPDVRGTLDQDAETDVDGALAASDTIARTIRCTQGRLQLQSILLQMALRDDLTGLHNRRGFIALATRQLKVARDTGQHLVMFFADLDGLKSINDRFGHGAGDQAIAVTAACIKETFRRFDVTARLSGDEFVALIMEQPGRSGETIRRRLQANLAARVGADCPYSLSLSVGVAHFDPEKPVTLLELMRQADTALYKHKRERRSVGSDAVAVANSESTACVAAAAKRPASVESTIAPAKSHRWPVPLELSSSLPRG